MMRLPFEFRRCQGLADEIYSSCWPELLQFPFNEFIGWRSYLTRPKCMLRRLRRRVGRLKTLYAGAR